MDDAVKVQIDIILDKFRPVLMDDYETKGIEIKYIAYCQCVEQGFSQNPHEWRE